MHHLHQLRFKFPLFLGTTRRYLDLSSNAISGTIPKGLSTLTLLDILQLDDNEPRKSPGWART
jgi:hypothetical protein